jgi:hypothetical protein
VPKPQRDDYFSVVDDLVRRVDRLERTPGLRTATIPADPDPDTKIDYVAFESRGIIWPLMFNAASLSPYKWESVGASPLDSGPGGGISTTSNVPVALTGGPTVVVPRDGDYRAWGVIFMAQQAAGVTGLQGALAANGVVLGTAAIGQAYIIGQTTFDGGVMPYEIPFVTFGAGWTLAMKVATSGSMNSQFGPATINLSPIRIR